MPDSEDFCILRGKTSENFNSILFLILEQNFYSKKIPYWYVEWFCQKNFGRAPWDILAIFAEFSTDFCHFDLSFFFSPVGPTKKIV